MIRMFEAELQKLTRRRLLLAIGGVILVAAIATTVLVFATAEPARNGDFSRAPTLEALAAPGGGSEAFSLGVSFLGLFVLVLSVANWSGEFSRATSAPCCWRSPIGRSYWPESRWRCSRTSPRPSRSVSW